MAYATRPVAVPAAGDPLDLPATADAWLKQLPQWAPELQRAALWQQSEAGEAKVLAGLPTLADAAQLLPLAAPAGQAPQGPTIHRQDGVARIDFPVPHPVAGRLLVCLALADLPTLDTQRLVRQLHWGLAWLLRTGDQQALQAQQQRLDRARAVIDTGAALLDQASPLEAALALVNLLAQRFDASLVQLGRVQHLQARVFARSHSASFDPRARLTRLAEAAMHCAVDDRTLVLWPPADGGPRLAGALADYAHEQKAGGLAVLPLLHQGQVHGVLMLERDRPFAPDEAQALEITALTTGPIFALHDLAAQGVWRRAASASRTALRTLTDSSHPALKLGALALALAIALAALVPVAQRVSARAVTEGEVQRAAVAPFAGYVREALVRAGDEVQAGQVLAVLDDKDLRLERQRLESELEISQRKEREAIAGGNRVETRLAAAQSDSTRAQLDLVLEKLQRVRISAPQPGVVVKGDLSQQIGAPVELGEVLFEIAPLDAWRIVLEIDERDIGLVQLGQRGQIVLTTLPGQPLDFSVRRITAVASARDGRNFFRAEAQLAQPLERLRPGLEGVAKVTVGEGAALAVWTRHFRQWARVTLWEWSP